MRIKLEIWGALTCILVGMALFCLYKSWQRHGNCERMCRNASVAICYAESFNFNAATAVCQSTENNKSVYSIKTGKVEGGDLFIDDLTCSSSKGIVKEVPAVAPTGSAMPDIVASSDHAPLLTYADVNALLNNASKSLDQLKPFETDSQWKPAWRSALQLQHQSLDIEVLKLKAEKDRFYWACEGKYTVETCPMNWLIPKFEGYNEAWLRVKQLFDGEDVDKLLTDPLMYHRYYSKR